jgi:hypothetical protein
MKVVLTLALAGFFRFAAEAQDEVNKSIELFNQAASSLDSKSYDEAIAKANEAYALVASSPEGSEEVKVNLEKIIPKIHFAKAKSKLSDKQFDEAIVVLNETAEIAKKFNAAELAADALETIPTAYLAQTKQLMDENKNDEAIAAVDKAIAADSANPQAYLMKGGAYLKKSDGDNAEKTLLQALAKAEQANNTPLAEQAKAYLSGIYVSKAAAGQKNKKWNEVIKNAEKSLQYKETPNALTLLDLANYNLGVEAQTKNNKAKACEYYKKVKGGNANAKKAADAAIKTLGCN